MCLNLGGGQNMLKPVVPPTDKAKQWRTYLLICGIINFALAFMLCFVNVLSGIYEMINVSILFCSISSVNYCCLSLYMIYITMFWL